MNVMQIQTVISSELCARGHCFTFTHYNCHMNPVEAIIRALYMYDLYNRLYVVLTISFRFTISFNANFPLVYGLNYDQRIYTLISNLVKIGALF